jgi:hypothetical protein
VELLRLGPTKQLRLLQVLRVDCAAERLGPKMFQVFRLAVRVRQSEDCKNVRHKSRARTSLRRKTCASLGWGC